MPLDDAASGPPLILLVDDDPDIVASLRLHLRAEHYVVEAASDVASGKRLVRERLPHLAVVDLMLPDGSGLDVARDLRQYADVPIIVLTGVDDEESKIAQLGEFADDYVTKPFNARELTARIASVLRRAWPSGRPSATLRLAHGVAIDFSRRQIRRGDQTIRLTPTESRLLWLLAGNAGQVVPSQTLIARVWPAAEVAPSSLWEYIRRLREKLDDDPTNPQFIVTERDVGYRFQLRAEPAPTPRA